MKIRLILDTNGDFLLAEDVFDLCEGQLLLCLSGLRKMFNFPVVDFLTGDEIELEVSKEPVSGFKEFLVRFEPSFCGGFAPIVDLIHDGNMISLFWEADEFLTDYFDIENTCFSEDEDFVERKLWVNAKFIGQ